MCTIEYHQSRSNEIRFALVRAGVRRFFRLWAKGETHWFYFITCTCSRPRLFYYQKIFVSRNNLNPVGRILFFFDFRLVIGRKKRENVRATTAVPVFFPRLKITVDTCNFHRVVIFSLLIQHPPAPAISIHGRPPVLMIFPGQKIYFQSIPVPGSLDDFRNLTNPFFFSTIIY